MFLWSRIAGLRLHDGRSAGRRRALQSARAQAAPHPGSRPGKGLHFRLHGRRPVAPGNLRPQAAPQSPRRTDAPRRIRRRQVSERQFVLPPARQQAHVQEVRQLGHRSLGPVPAPGRSRGRPVRHPFHARRHGGALRRAIPDDERPRHSGLSGHGQLGGLRARLGIRVAPGLRGDAGSARRPGGRAAHVQPRLPAFRVPAHSAAAGQQAGAQPGPAQGRVPRRTPADHRTSSAR